jgi:hypothetical protein
MELANQKEMMAMIEVWLEEMEANLGKIDVTEMEAVAEHYNRAPCVKATHLLTPLQGRVSGVLQADSKGATYEETIGSLEDRFGDQNLAVGYCNQRKTCTWNSSIKEGATYHYG